MVPSRPVCASTRALYLRHNSHTAPILDFVSAITGKAPGNRSPPRIRQTLSGSDPSRLQKLAGARNWDRTRLHRLRNLAHKLDVKEPVLQARAFDLNMVGELESTFEGPLGDALVEQLAGLVLVVGRFFPADRQPVL